MFSGCGIAGALRFRRHVGPAPSVSDVCRATSALAHRGPNGESLRQTQGVVLAIADLSLVGLGEDGAQLMTRDHSTLVYNGELHNFVTLRKQLGRDYVFESDTDTEVVLRAWQKWGLMALGKFDGMFAFALWDERKKCLHFVHDRLGIKPLYYYRTGGFIVFASEVEALICRRASNRSKQRVGTS
jgi:asparagine synthase (glutamine-hydrolysing)